MYVGGFPYSVPLYLLNSFLFDLMPRRYYYENGIKRSIMWKTFMIDDELEEQNNKLIILR